MSEEHLRIGDAEREVAAAALGEHYAQGRITADEHTERLDQVWAARTRAELQPVFRDLPDPSRRTPSPVTRSGRARGPRRDLPGPLFVVLAVLIVLTLVTHLPFVVAGVLVAVLVVSRRRHRFGPPHRVHHWSR